MEWCKVYKVLVGWMFQLLLLRQKGLTHLLLRVKQGNWLLSLTLRGQYDCCCVYDSQGHALRTHIHMRACIYVIDVLCKNAVLMCCSYFCNSVAKCLGAKTVSKRSLDLTKEHPIHSCVVSDKVAVDACDKFLGIHSILPTLQLQHMVDNDLYELTVYLYVDDHHHLVEPACGAALAAVYYPYVLHNLQQQGKLPTPLSSVVVIVCGGNAVNIELLNKWKKEVGL